MKKKLAAILCLALCLSMATTAYALSPAPDEPPVPPVQEIEQDSREPLVLEQCVMGGEKTDCLHVSSGDVVIRSFTYTNLGDGPWSGNLYLSDPAFQHCDNIAVSGGELHDGMVGMHLEDMPAGASWKIIAVMVIPEGGFEFTDWLASGAVYGDNAGGACMVTQDTYFGDPDVTAECSMDGDDLNIKFRNDSEKATGSASCIKVRIRFHGLDSDAKKEVKKLNGVKLEDGRYEFPVGALCKGGKTEFYGKGLLKNLTCADITAAYGLPGHDETPIEIGFYAIGEPVMMPVPDEPPVVEPVP